MFVFFYSSVFSLVRYLSSCWICKCFAYHLLLGIIKYWSNIWNVSKSFFPLLSKKTSHRLNIRRKKCEKNNFDSHNGKIYEKTFYLSVVQPPTVTKTSTKNATERIEWEKKHTYNNNNNTHTDIEGNSDYFCEWLRSFRTRLYIFLFLSHLVDVSVCSRICIGFLWYDLLKYRKKKTITRKIYVHPFAIRWKCIGLQWQISSSSMLSYHSEHPVC